MSESSLFEYWFVWLFAVFFILWFPTYVVKTAKKGLSSWGLAFVIVCLFLFLPINAVTFMQEVWFANASTATCAAHEAPKVPLELGITCATLAEVYLVLAWIFVLVGSVQSAFSAWLLYSRHNRESLVRALRMMWTSCFMLILAIGALPVIMLQKAGMPIFENNWYKLLAYTVVITVITLYLIKSKVILAIYPESHQKVKQRA